MEVSEDTRLFQSNLIIFLLIKLVFGLNFLAWWEENRIK
jgi:hypothetical protein